jgi:hypothetical protein
LNISNLGVSGVSDIFFDKIALGGTYVPFEDQQGSLGIRHG